MDESSDDEEVYGRKPPAVDPATIQTIQKARSMLLKSGFHAPETTNPDQGIFAPQLPQKSVQRPSNLTNNFSLSQSNSLTSNAATKLPSNAGNSMPLIGDAQVSKNPPQARTSTRGRHKGGAATGVKQKKSTGGASTVYSDQETFDLLEILEQVLPIGEPEWQIVVRHHAKKWPQMEWTKNSLVCKFRSLWLATVPTGNPHCPDEVKLATRIGYKIEEKTNCVRLGDEDEEEGVIDQAQTADGDDQSEALNGTLSSSMSVSSTTPVSRVGSRKNNRRSVGGDGVPSFAELFQMQMLQMQHERQKDKM